MNIFFFFTNPEYKKILINGKIGLILNSLKRYSFNCLIENKKLTPLFHYRITRSRMHTAD